MPVAAFAPARLHYDYPEWTAPASGSTDTGKAWVWNHATGEYEPASFLLASAVSAFGLTLIDDADAATARTTLGLGTMATATETSYLLADGSRTGASSQAQTFTNGIVGPSWKPASDSTTALQLKNAAGTAFATGDTANLEFGFTKGFVGVRYPGALFNIEQSIAGNVTGGGGYIRALRFLPTLTSVAAGQFNSFLNNPIISGAFTQGLSVGIQVNNLTLSGGATATYMAGCVLVQQSAATNNTNLLIGSSTQPAGNFSIYNDSTYSNHFAGKVGIGTTSPNNLLDVAGTIQTDGLRLDVTPTTETITATHTITISVNGTDYKIPCVAA